MATEFSESGERVKNRGEIKDKNLTVNIVGDELVVSIGLSVLLSAVETSRFYGDGEIRITNETQFLEGFVRYLSNEKEDGSTLIHYAFDDAVTEMLENGELGVDDLEDV